MSKLEQQQANQVVESDYKRSLPVSGPMLKEKLARRNTLTYPKDDKTAIHRMQFLQFKKKSSIDIKVPKQNEKRPQG